MERAQCGLQRRARLQIVSTLGKLADDDALLVLERVVLEPRVTHAVGFESNRSADARGWNHLEQLHDVVFSRGVRPDGVHAREFRPDRDLEVLGRAEEVVLEQVRHALLTRRVVPTSDLVEHPDRDQGLAVVFVQDHAQPVLQRVPLAGNERVGLGRGRRDG